MLVVKNTPANKVGVRDGGLVPGLGRSPGCVYLDMCMSQYASCLENPMDSMKRKKAVTLKNVPPRSVGV